LKTISLLAAVFILLTSCGHSSQKKVSVKAINDSVVLLTNHYEDTSKFKQAIALLDEAIQSDTNYFESYRNKFFFEAAIGDFENAVKTTTQLIKFRPDSADLYFQRGIFKELSNDSITSMPDFNKATLLYRLTLDTMNKKSPNWWYTWRIAAVCLTMAGQEQAFQDLLKAHCKTSFDSSLFQVEVLTKSKQQILQEIRSKYAR
jgi:tetratricopeptide (TPR) repeat protein